MKGKYKKRQWGSNTDFRYYIDNKLFDGEACFTGLIGYKKEYKDITLCIPYLFRKKTITRSYVKNLVKIFNYEAKITKDLNVIFKSKGKNKDFIFLSCLRLSYEAFGDNNSHDDKINEFLEKVGTKCKSLEQFCEYYKEMHIKNDFFYELHSWRPYQTKIKSLKDFNNYNELKVNKFFTT